MAGRRKRKAKKPKARRTSQSESASWPEWAEGLTEPRHVLFLQNLVEMNFNQTKAYIAAGYSKNGASQSAARLLATAKIKEAYRKLLASIAMPVEELQAMIEQDARASTASLEDFITVNSHGEPMVDWAAAKASGALKYVRELKVTPGKFGTTISYKLVDDQKAKDQLIKIHGMAVSRHEHSGPGGKPIQSQGVGVRLTKEELDKLDAHEKAALWRDIIRGGDD